MDGTNVDGSSSGDGVATGAGLISCLDKVTVDGHVKFISAEKMSCLRSRAEIIANPRCDVRDSLTNNASPKWRFIATNSWYTTKIVENGIV